MANKPITEKVTVTREVTGVIADLIKFARFIHPVTTEQLRDDEYMVDLARRFWDQQHGED